MPPTWSAAAKRSLCWGSAVTWPPYGLSWGFWPRSSSWSSSLLFMRSVRSRRIYKTVSHQSRCLGVFYYCTVFNISEGSVLTRISAVNLVQVFFFFCIQKACQCVALSFRVSSEVIPCPETPMESPDTVPAFNNSVWRGWPQADTVAEGRTLSGQFHAFNIHEKYDTAVLWRWTGSIINGFPPRNLLCARAAASVTTRHSFSYTTCACHPRIA